MSSPEAALFDPWTRDYVLLGLRMDRLAPGTVDAWLGPPEWRAAVHDEPQPTPVTIRGGSESLLERLPHMGYAPRRTEYLARQVTALQAGARLLSGEAIPLGEQAALFFDIQIERVPESVFEAAHTQIDALLPGTGSLGERMVAWRRQFEVPRERILDLARRMIVEVRSRTALHLSMPPDETIDLVLVHNQPWGAYNWYLGNARSRIEINTDLPTHAHTLVDYAAHEGYPGHHTEHALRELMQYREGGQGEYAIQLINTPESLISEAIATCARGLIFEGAEDLEWLAANVLPSLGMKADPAQVALLREAREALSGVRGNAAFLLHEGGRPAAEVAAYLERWELCRPEEARKRLEFLQSPLWRAYTFTYTFGRRLLQPLLAGPDRFGVFRRIVTEPIYPALLATWSAPAP